MSLGPWEILLIVMVVLLLFGGKKFPELAKGLGKGLKEFKKSMHEPDTEEESKSIKSADN
ncbi:MAG: twin-arginine translocase TatA/TatE family subunit [Calditrichaeota bacterium]|nr:MAG: twin-arginine translocase TatA/TatE family subunit [Calditrichota bacterium]